MCTYNFYINANLFDDSIFASNNVGQWGQKQNYANFLLMNDKRMHVRYSTFVDEKNSDLDGYQRMKVKKVLDKLLYY